MPLTTETVPKQVETNFLIQNKSEYSKTVREEGADEQKKHFKDTYEQQIIPQRMAELLQYFTTQ